MWPIPVCFFFIQTIRAFLPSMLEKNHGYIVAMASAAAFISFPGLIDYSASKAALVSFMKTLQSEIVLTKKSGVTVTCVCPGKVDTGFGERFSLSGLSRESKNKRMMTVEAAASRIIEAVTNREFVVIFPRGMTIITFLSTYDEWAIYMYKFAIGFIVAFFCRIMPSSLLKWLFWRAAKKWPEIDLATGKSKE